MNVNQVLKDKTIQIDLILSKLGTIIFKANDDCDLDMTIHMFEDTGGKRYLSMKSPGDEGVFVSEEDPLYHSFLESPLGPEMDKLISKSKGDGTTPTLVLFPIVSTVSQDKQEVLF